MASSPHPTASGTSSNDQVSQPSLTDLTASAPTSTVDQAQPRQTANQTTLFYFFGGSNLNQNADFKLVITENESDGDGDPSSTSNTNGNETVMRDFTNNLTFRTMSTFHRQALPACPAGSVMLSIGDNFTIMPARAIRANSGIIDKLTVADKAANNANNAATAVLAGMVTGTTLAVASLFSSPSVANLSEKSMNPGLMKQVLSPSSARVMGVVGGIALAAYSLHHSTRDSSDPSAL